MKVYLAPWVLHSEEGDQSFVPKGFDGASYGAVDLRPRVPFALVGSDEEVSEPGVDLLGEGEGLREIAGGREMELPVPAQTRTRLLNRLGLNAEAGSVTRLLQWFLVEDADASRPDRLNPLRPSRTRRRMEMFLGGRLVWEMPLVSGGATITDDFNRANQDLEASADWTAIAGDLNIVSNQVQTNVTTECLYRHTSQLDSDDHSVEKLITSVSGTNDFPAVSARFDTPSPDTSANSTFYWGRYRTDSLLRWEILKRVAGTSTVLANNAEAAPATPYIVRLTADGSSLVLEKDATTKVSVTDTAITGHLKVGVRDNGPSVGAIKFDNFEAADLAAAHALEGSGDSAASGKGVFLIARPLLGSGDAASDGTGVLPVVLALGGSGDAASDGSGHLALSLDLDGSGDGASSGAGSLAAVLDLDGSGAAASSGEGSFSLTAALSGIGPAASSGSGDLEVAAQLDGSGGSAGDGTGSLSVALTLEGTGSAAGDGDGLLVATKQFSGSGDGASSGQGLLGAVLLLEGAGSSAGDGTGVLGVIRFLLGSGDIAADGDGSLIVTRELAGSGEGASVGEGVLTRAALFAGIGSAASSGAAILGPVGVPVGGPTDIILAQARNGLVILQVRNQAVLADSGRRKVVVVQPHNEIVFDSGRRKVVLS